MGEWSQEWDQLGCDIIIRTLGVLTFQTKQTETKNKVFNNIQVHLGIRQTIVAPILYFNLKTITKDNNQQR